MPTARITHLYRYPVKGLSAEALDEAMLQVDEPMAFDRKYAIANGKIPFDPAAPSYLPKAHFLMLMKNEGLAKLSAAFSEEGHILRLSEDDKEQVSGSLETEEGRAAIEAFLQARFADQARGQLRITSAPGHSFSDVAMKVLHLVNLETVRDLEGKVGVPVDPLRFRANVYIDGLPAWSEFDLVDKQITAGGVTFEVVDRTVRCAATEVNPTSGVRDIKMRQWLGDLYGHTDCGIYMRVAKGGRVRIGDELRATSAI